MAFKRNTAQAPGTDIEPAAPPAATAPAVAPRKTADPVPLSDAQLAIIEEAISGIPDGGESGQWGMIEQLLNATRPTDLNAPWDGTAGKDLFGKRLLIRSLKRRPSGFEGGPSIFLVVDSVNTQTGEPVTWFTSALAVIVQLAACHRQGWLPVIADITPAPRPTAAGFLPYHLNIVQVNAT